MPRPKGVKYELKKYALTLVPVAKENQSRAKLEAKYSSIEKSYELETVDMCYEQKLDGTDHIHAYVISRRSLFLKADKFIGWSIRIEPIFDLQGWTAYLRKHQPPIDPDSDQSPPCDLPDGYMFIDEA